MTITLAYSGQARSATNRAREQLDLPDRATLNDLLADLARRYGDPFRAVAPTLLIFVGDEQVDRDAPRSLRPDDEVTLLSPISGG
jgi:molybdopterin converting factor small subunit